MGQCSLDFLSSIPNSSQRCSDFVRPSITEKAYFKWSRSPVQSLNSLLHRSFSILIFLFFRSSTMKKYVLSQFTGHLYHRSRSLCSNTPLDVLPEIKNGLASGKPIVALESTIITHGMPYPHNLKTAKEVEEIVRSQVLMWRKN